MSTLAAVVVAVAVAAAFQFVGAKWWPMTRVDDSDESDGSEEQ